MILGMQTPPPAVFIHPADVQPETTLDVGRRECAICDLEPSFGSALLCQFHDGFNQGVVAGQFVCDCRRLDCQALRHKEKAS